MKVVSSVTITHQNPDFNSSDHKSWAFHSGFNFTASIIQRRGVTAELNTIGETYRALVRRQDVDPTTGALYCTDGPCADGRWVVRRRLRKGFSN
jgi:hypothetical protein